MGSWAGRWQGQQKAGRWHGRQWGGGWHGRQWGGGWHGPGGYGHRWRAGRSRPLRLAMVIALVQVLGTTMTARDQPADLDALGYLLLAAGGLLLAGRVRHPVATVAAVAAATVAYHSLAYPRGPTFVALIVAGVVAVKAGHRYAVWGIAAGGYATLVVTLGLGLDQALVLAAWVAGSLLAAELMRVRGNQRAQLEQVRAEQARVRAEQQRRQASEQRLRIAQELHDVLGHHLSLINVQAGVGLHLMDSRPEQARAALGAIKQASAEALREVRSVLAALHPVEGSAPRAPAPGLDRLDELIDAAGARVRAVVAGAPRQLPAELDRAAYRIVQEALTNVRRHAGAGASATVTVEYGERELIVQIEDDGGGPDGPGATESGEAERIGSGEGSGISGMRERAMALGGSLSAERRGQAADTGDTGDTGDAGVGTDTGEAGGQGFRVRARLPLPPRQAGGQP